VNDQLGFDGMPARLLKVTPSKLSTWASCRRRYRMTYLDRPPPPRGGAWAHSTLGAVVHSALRTCYESPPRRRTVDAARAAVARAWSGEGFADIEQQARYRERAQDWVADYLSERDPAQVEAVGLERWVAAPVGTLVVEGRVDRLDTRANSAAPDGAEVVVVDYKTGRRPLSDDDARTSQALALYVLATRRTLRRPTRRVELHHLPTGQVHAFDHTAASLERQLRRAEEQAQDIAAATDALAAGGDNEALFPPSPGGQCSWCDLRRSCPEGRSAAPQLEPWAGLAT
jgi:putative RecB family exonuclease